MKGFKKTAKRDLRLTLTFAVATGLAVIAQGFLVARILDELIFRGRTFSDVTRELVLLAAVILARAGAVWATDRFAFSAAAVVMRSLRAHLISRVERIGPVGLAERKTGETVAAIADGVRAIEPYYSRYIPASVMATLLPLAIFCVVLPFDWLSALVFVVTAPLIPVFMILIGEGAEKLNQRQWGRLQRMSGHLLDAVQGLATLKAFNAARRMTEQVAKVADAYRRDTMAVLRIAFLSSLVLEFFATVSIAIVAVLVGFRLLWGEIGYFEGLFILLLAPEFYLPLRSMGTAYHARMEAIGAAEGIVALEDVPALAEPGGAQAVFRPERIAISFEDVELTFAGGRRALDGVSFQVAAGEAVALVGPSGGGKSSLLNLLLGFVQPTSGRVRVNGVALGALDMAEWRSMIGYVPQAPRILSGTLAANIAPQDDTPDMERLEKAARQADLFDVIARLPDGFDTRIGEGGAGLSGGEAHRLALARAFYRDAPVIVLDEPTAHLDRDSEARVQAAIARLLPGRTALMVAHRRATIEQAGRVVGLRAGRLADPAGIAEEEVAP
nr:thiol reductant ABC exporter subunit CydD [Breoghania corrubedonensis]